jgi:hypothetical protein
VAAKQPAFVVNGDRRVGPMVDEIVVANDKEQHSPQHQPSVERELSRQNQKIKAGQFGIGFFQPDTPASTTTATIVLRRRTKTARSLQ